MTRSDYAQLNQEDTICALATAPSGGSIGIIRLSGPASFDIAAAIFTGGTRPFESHRVYYGHITARDTRIDEVLLLTMKAPKSYTREDVVEIHCHGGVLSTQRVLQAALCAGARLAAPGEFTKRAFLNGRIDLSQAEAVSDLIGAQTALAHQSALHQLSGALSVAIRAQRAAILQLIAQIEANIDYPEHDIEALSTAAIAREIKTLAEAIQKLIDSADSGRLIREGIETVLVGRPNVGKSSILNRLLREDRAIVTDIPGTTRDIVREFVNMNNIPLHLIDTAGLRKTDDAIEKIGVSLAWQHARRADLILAVVDGGAALTEEDEAFLTALSDKPILILVNKSDLAQKTDIAALQRYTDPENILLVSAKENDGLDAVAKRLTALFFSGGIDYTGAATITNTRHKDCLTRALRSLQNALATAAQGLSQDLLSIDLIDAYEVLGEITGESVNEDLIDAIFSQFCLGK